MESLPSRVSGSDVFQVDDQVKVSPKSVRSIYRGYQRSLSGHHVSTSTERPRVERSLSESAIVDLSIENRDVKTQKTDTNQFQSAQALLSCQCRQDDAKILLKMAFKNFATQILSTELDVHAALEPTVRKNLEKTILTNQLLDMMLPEGLLSEGMMYLLDELLKDGRFDKIEIPKSYSFRAAWFSSQMLVFVLICTGCADMFSVGSANIWSSAFAAVAIAVVLKYSHNKIEEYFESLYQQWPELTVWQKAREMAIFSLQLVLAMAGCAGDPRNAYLTGKEWHSEKMGYVLASGSVAASTLISLMGVRLFLSNIYKKYRGDVSDFELAAKKMSPLSDLLVCSLRRFLSQFDQIDPDALADDKIRLLILQQAAFSVMPPGDSFRAERELALNNVEKALHRKAREVARNHGSLVHAYLLRLIGQDWTADMNRAAFPVRLGQVGAMVLFVVQFAGSFGICAVSNQVLESANSLYGINTSNPDYIQFPAENGISRCSYNSTGPFQGNSVDYILPFDQIGHQFVFWSGLYWYQGALIAGFALESWTRTVRAAKMLYSSLSCTPGWFNKCKTFVNFVYPSKTPVTVASRTTAFIAGAVFAGCYLDVLYKTLGSTNTLLSLLSCLWGGKMYGSTNDWAQTIAITAILASLPLVINCLVITTDLLHVTFNEIAFRYDLSCKKKLQTITPEQAANANSELISLLSGDRELCSNTRSDLMSKIARKVDLSGIEQTYDALKSDKKAWLNLSENEPSGKRMIQTGMNLVRIIRQFSDREDDSYYDRLSHGTVEFIHAFQENNI